jgi:hypothetical protein
MSDEPRSSKKVENFRAHFYDVWQTTNNQGRQILLRALYQKRWKIYQITIKYTNWQQNIPIGNKIYQLGTKYTYRQQNGSKIDQMAITYIHMYIHIYIYISKIFPNCYFGLKICHLATLPTMRSVTVVI